MFIKWSRTPSKVQDHFYAKIILAHLFMDRFWWKFVWMLISWRHNMWPELSLFFCHGEVLWFFTLRPSDMITTLTYVFIDNFYPCFLYTRKLQHQDITPFLLKDNFMNSQHTNTNLKGYFVLKTKFKHWFQRFLLYKN